jgi:DNA-binding response OmpR family regulator
MGQTGETKMPRLLVIEDQKKLLQSLQRGLEEEGYEVTPAATGEQGYYAATTEAIDAVILDLMLPGRHGLLVLRDLRANGFAKPVLILTARDAVEDRVSGLDAGADDYLVKPFAFAELLARLRAILRRDVSGRELFLRVDDLEMDLLARRVVRDGIELDLTRREFELLEYLLRHKNSAVTRDMIARDVWKDAHGAPTNSIDVYITLLRKKVERHGLRQVIHTIRGVGYAARDAT